VPIPYAVTRWNRDVLNHGMRPLVRHLPGFGVVHHVGRRSGRPFETPVNLFPVSGGFVIALTYGSHTDWVRNVVAAGECGIETRGLLVHCADPEVYRDPERHHIRLLERQVLGLLHVEEFMRLRRT
jgi:deazaflavin-dependent oxidoreductase (nitroreductase family)